MLAARISTVFYPSAPLSPSPSPCHLGREPDLALPLTSHTVVAPDLRPKAAWSVNNVPASAFLCWGGCLYLAPVWAVKPTLLLRTTVYLFLFFLPCLCFPPSNSFWPGLASDRQHNLSTATAFSDRLHPSPCHTYSHAGLYVLTNLPGRDLPQPLCEGCVLPKVSFNGRTFNFII